MNSTEPTPTQQQPGERNESLREQGFPGSDWPGQRFRGGRMRRGFHPLRAVRIVAMVIFCVVVFGFVTEHLWNWLMPSIFHLRAITFVEAIGLVMLGKILFGGIHKGGRRGGPGGERWKQHMKAKFEAMTPEQREKFRAGMRGGRWCRPDRTTRSESTQGGL